MKKNYNIEVRFQNEGMSEKNDRTDVWDVWFRPKMEDESS